MRVIHLQIFAAVMSLGFVGAGVGAMTIHSGRQESDRKLAKAEAELRALRGIGGGLAGTVKPKPSKELEAESQRLAALLRTLEEKVKALERENAMLKESLVRSAQPRPAGAKPIPGGGMTPSGPAPVPVVEARPSGLEPGAPPPPAEPAYNEQWGESSDGELDEIASVLKLSQEQRSETRQIIMDGQNEFLKLLADPSLQEERDITIIERIGEQVSKKTQGRIRGILKPEQHGAFDDLMRRKEEMR